ncbi:chorismate synthase [Parasediminibacterium sp. JCM 36343]|uniref:chorismate synthase n=1 Tax=Parasediminibacterium sp. JCM 36343 TaxID=3374279 RepID=UPI00397BC2F6
MNSFGRIFRVNIFGESHGECAGVNIDGCPAGLALSVHDFLPDIERRKGGTQKGTTPRQETDLPIFKSGIFNGYTTGAPITIIFENNNTRSSDYQKQRDFPRPGHADFVAHQKYGGFEDFRGGGHFSGRLTVCLVAVGVIAKKLLKGIEVKSTILEIGGEQDLEKGLQKAIDAKDSIGGIVDCKVNGLPLGLGEHFFDSIESLLAHAAFAIPAVKGIEFGSGFEAAKMFGVQHNDAIIDAAGKTATNHAGGAVGGITNGNEFVFRIAIKPTSSTPKEQQSLNWNTNEVESFSIKGRHDLCIALRVPVVLEAITAMVLVDFMILENRLPRVIAKEAPIYHITTQAAWEAAKEKGYYEAASLAIEGFIHCSTDEQVKGTLERFFAGQTNLVKLVIQPEKLANPLKYEIAPSLNIAFPHVFGTINLESIIGTEVIDN